MLVDVYCDIAVLKSDVNEFFVAVARTVYSLLELLLSLKVKTISMALHDLTNWGHVPFVSMSE